MNKFGVAKEDTTWESSKTFGVLKDGTKVTKGEILFPRIEKTEELFKVEEEEEPQEDKKNIITIDELDKVELKVGQILTVEKVPKAKKLYKLSVDVGEMEYRTILSGLRKFYSEKKINDMKVIVISNLAPRKMMGMTSNGMLLAATNSDESKVILLSPSEDIDNGSKIS